MSHYKSNTAFLNFHSVMSLTVFCDFKSRLVHIHVFMCPLKESKVLSLAWDSLVGRSPEEVKQQKQQKLKGEIKEVIFPISAWAWPD